MSLRQYFHIGIIVPDLVAARARFTELLGSEWGPVLDYEIEVRDADGHEAVLPNRMCYSTQPPHIELIVESPGTPWVCNEHSNIHHIGFFSGTLGTDSGRLDAAGCPLEIMGGHGTGRPDGWAYHRDLLGVRVELVDEALRVPMEEYLFRPPSD